MSSCAWVTHCLTEQDVEKALVLGKSLRRVLTRKSLAVIVHSDLSQEWMNILKTTFDFVIPIQAWDSGFLKNLIPPDSLALSFALTFTFFDKCIFLNPETLVLKNCDDLFETAADSDACVGGNGRKDMGVGCPIYFSPSNEAFMKLTESVRECTEDDIVSDATFLNWISSTHTADYFLPLDYSSLGLDEKRVLGNDESLNIVHLRSLPRVMTTVKEFDFKDAGILEKFVYGNWLELYTTAVKSPEQDTATNCFQPKKGMKKGNEPIAVVGMSCRLPASKDLNEFWNLLIEGGDAICHPPEDRFKKEHYPNYDRTATNAGFLSVPVDEFDAKFFGLSPKEVVYMDPQIRILHEVVWEGLEDAGINPANLKGTPAGVFLGSYQNEYVNILQSSEEGEHFRTWMGNSISAGAARISHLLGLTGPSIGTNPACSASLAALHMATQSLRKGECSMAIACAANLILLPFTPETPGLDAITASDGHCKTFDASADGFGRAEGCTVLVLKKLSDAVRDGERIWGLIRGTSLTQEGLSRSIGTPTATCEAKAMQLALKDGNVHPSEVSFIEAHGTGTVVGDTTEIHAISRIYGNVQRDRPLVIGSVKTNVGHTEACSGMTGIMKVFLSMKNEIIPRHRNFNQLNPNIDLESIPAQLPLDPIQWPKVPGKPRMAGVCSFGFTGMDGHAVVQEYDTADYCKQQTYFPGFERPLHILKISAKNEEALTEMLERYKSSLQSEPAKFSDMAYTANVGRATFPFRAALVAPDSKSALNLLETGRVIRSGTATPEAANKNICFLFTGQGSQYHGMAKQLYSTSPIFHSNFDYCDNFLKAKYDISIKDVFFSEEESQKANRTLYSQTGIFVVEYCLLKLWESWGIKPDIVLGHSLGEFGAAVAAGILDLDDALTLVAERSSLIENLPPGKMLVVKLDKSATESQVEIFKKEKYLGKDTCLDFAAVNTPEQTVLAGDSEIILEFKEFLRNNGGAKSSVLQSTHAFHSRQMDPMLEKYRSVAERIVSKKSENGCTFISGMMGEIVDGTKVDADYWVRHTREKVNFLQASKVAYEDFGCGIFLEVGPHPVLSAMTMMNNNTGSMTSLFLPSLRKSEGDWGTILNSLGKLFVLGKADINWEGFDKFYERSKVGQFIPTYPFKRSKYWPRILTSRNMELHPLLGSAIPNPTQLKLFQGEVKPNDKLEYLRDHMIGDKIVFPGAGYMEMLMMAGHAAMGGQTSTSLLPKRPISISNFQTKTALGLNDGGERIMCQTIVQHAKASSQDAEGFPVEMYHEVSSGESSNWIQHATASFAPYYINSQNPGGDKFQAYQDHEKNLENIQSLQQSISNDDNFGKQLYDKVTQLGLNFGPTFRTLERLWRDQESKQLLAEVETPKWSDKYLLHPTLIDAMIQMALFLEKGLLDWDTSGRKLFVPTGCEKFIWFAPLKTSSCYIHKNYQDLNNPVVILDSEGNLVAALCGVTSIETSVSTIKAMLETQVNSRPDFFTVEWIPTLHPHQNRIDFSVAPDPIQLIDSEPTDLTDHSPEAQQIMREADTVVGSNIILALQRLGWSPKLPERISLKEFASGLKILPEHKKLLRQFLVFLEEDEILESLGEAEWIVKTLPKSEAYLTEEVAEIVEKQSATSEKSLVDALLLADTVGKNLDKILTGRQSALEVLFPESEAKPTAKKFYDYIVKYSDIVEQLWKKQLALLKESYKASHLSLPVLRILEVGAGTGSMSEIILRTLHDAEVPCEYVYTDISASFFPSAEKRLEQYRSSIKFRKLNLEQDPASQGFPSKYFDVVIGAEVIHATRDIRESLMNIKQVMRDGGSLWLVENLGSDRMVDSIFGLLEGYWRFTDLELRPNHPMLMEDTWKEVLNDMGFTQFGYCHRNKFAAIVAKTEGKSLKSNQKLLPKLNSKMQAIQEEANRSWLVFYLEEEEAFVNDLASRFNVLERKKLIFIKQKHSGSIAKLSDMEYEINPERKEDMDRLFKLFFKRGQDKQEVNFPPVEGLVVTWGITSTTMRDQSALARPFHHLLQNLFQLPHKSMPQLILLTSGQWPVGDIVCNNPSSTTLLGLAQTAVNERPEVRIKGIDVHPQQLEQGMDELFHEMFSTLDEDPSYFTIFRGGVRYLPKFVGDRNRDKSLALPFGTSRFQLMHSKSKTVQELQFVPLEQYSLGPNDIEIQVKCIGLNFKDVISVLKPSEEFENYDLLGLDFSGVVTRLGRDVTKWKLGDAVCSFRSVGNAFPSHIQTDADVVVEVPKNWTFAEAASIPTVFCTARYCLDKYGKVKEGETLLVHTASGGVGLAAIQVAKELGLNVICTAGSHRKRAYLRSLGVEHVFNSRTTDYGREILRVTQGKGVDVVFNTLTGVGFKEATLEACGKGARFIEISKLNIWTEEEVKTFRPDVEYTIVDLTTTSEAERMELLGCQERWTAEGILTPIPYTRFDAVDIRQGLTFLQKAQHIGKVVCSFPEPDVENGNMAVEQVAPLFNKKSTYLITGGLGGVGMEVCKYMVEQGAGHIVLVGRNPPNAKTAAMLETIRKESTCQVQVVQADIGLMSDCEKVFTDIQDNLPPLRGVMHVAGTLADGLLDKLTWDKFQHTYQSKVNGSWNLHELSKNMILEHFVLFSSFASPMAAAGQGNYASACRFEDGLTLFRNSNGLPATTINWGQFGEVGLAAEADLAVARPFSPQQGINALDEILRKNRNHLTAIIFNSSAEMHVNMYPFSKWMIGDLISNMFGKRNKDSGANAQINSTQFGKDYDGCKTVEEKIEVMREAIKICLKQVLRLNPDEGVDGAMEFEEMGMDSLMMIELQNFLQSILKGRLTVSQSAWNNCTTVNSLGKRFVELIEGDVDRPAEVPPTLDEIRELILKDAKLPDRIQTENPGSEKKTSQIKTILLTGATGYMGSHILNELLENCPQVEKIYCLVRKRQKMSPEQRLVSAFQKNNLKIKQEYFEGRVTPIHGNLTEAKLGLPEETYSALAGDVDAVIHFGAQVNQTEYYKEISGGKYDARSINVGGLLNVLEFACKSKTKHIFNASTIAAVLQSIEGDSFTEEWPDISALAVETTSGYFASQYVCDALLKQATDERGIPCKSFRFSSAMGEPPTSVESSFSDQSLFMKMILFALKERVMPEKPIPVNVIPVQVAAKISVKIMFSEEAPNEIYNVFHPRPHLLQECLTIMASEMGFEMKVIDHDRSREQVLQSHGRGEDIQQFDESSVDILKDFEKFFSDDNLFSFYSYANTLAETYLKNRDFFKSKKVSTFAPEHYCVMESSYDILKRWMDKIKKEGAISF